MNQIKQYTIIGILFVLTAGTLSHFLYDWTGNNTIIGLFTPVNESIWEHMKLLFFPMLAYSLLMIIICRRNYPCIIAASCLGILTGTFLIPLLYYSYTFILGKDVFILDIATFILSILIAFWLTYRLALSCKRKTFTLFLFTLVYGLFVCFIIFTYHPPDASIFKDPAASKAGCIQSIC